MRGSQSFDSHGTVCEKCPSAGVRSSPCDMCDHENGAVDAAKRSKTPSAAVAKDFVVRSAALHGARMLFGIPSGVGVFVVGVQQQPVVGG